jgi:peptide/nickel transport system substrate-binding protein
MAYDPQPARTTPVRALLLGLVCLIVGAGVGRWTLSRKPAGEQRWADVDELTQMYLIPSGYNFVESNKSYENHLLALVHDQLLHFDPVQNQLVPGLARTFDVSPDGLTWTFRLRPAHTPDGVALTAEDVVFSFNLCLDERFDCKKSGNFVINKKRIVAAAVDPLTVTFRLPEPFYSFPSALAGVFVVPKSVFAPVAGNEQDFRRAVGVQQPDLKYLRGFGPYAVEAQDTQEVRLVRNDRFWGRGDDQFPRPHVRRITLALRKEDALSELDFLRDDRFLYRLVGPMEGERIRDDTRFQILDRGVSGWCMFFWVNQNPQAPWGKTHPRRLELFQRVEFRRALAHAIDRDALIRCVFKGQAEPLYGPASPIFRWTAPAEVLRDVTPKTDPAAAVAELAPLGVTPGEPDGEGKRWLMYEENGRRVPLEIEIRTSKSDEDVRRRTAEELKAQLEGIGVRVKVVEERFGDMVARLDKTYDYEAAVMALEGSPDAAVLRFFFESSGPMHFVNPRQKSPATDWERRVDESFKVYATSPDPTARDRAIVDLQTTWVAAQPAFHLYNDRKSVAVRRDYEVNGLALTGRAADPVLERTVIENVRLRRLVPANGVGP